MGKVGVLAALALLLQGGAEIRSPDALVEPPFLAWPVQTTLAPASRAERGLAGRVEVDTQAKALRIEWSFDDARGQRVFGTQVFALDFWPTAAEEVAGALVVAGIRPKDGNTLIERWVLSCPETPGNAGAPYAAELVGKRSLHDDRAAGRNGVRFLSELHGARGAQGGLLIQFHDSNDLHALDVAAASFVGAVYTAAEVPALASPIWRSIWAGEHAVHGYVYVYSRHDDGDLDQEPLVLLDTDKDGAIDAWHQWGPAEWEAELGPPVDWVRVFPN